MRAPSSLDHRIEEIRSLNTLRGLAALIVLVSHFSGATGWLGEYPASGAGQLGVMLFFILSGFLMGYLYLDRDFNRATVRRYAVARFARVVPLFAMVVALSALLPRLGIRGVFYDLPDRAQVASHVLLLSGKSILWTIPTELQFYAVFVLWWFVAKKTPVGLPLILAVAATAFLGITRIKGSLGPIPYELRLPQVISYFAVGALLGVAYRKWPILRQRQHRAAALVLLAVIVMYPKIFETIFGERHGLWTDARVFVLMSLVFATIVFAVPAGTKILANAAGDFLGTISYSLYLLHVPVMWAVRKMPFADTVRFAIFLALSMGVASLSFWLLERPIGRVMRERLLPQESAVLRSPLR